MTRPTTPRSKPGRAEAPDSVALPALTPFAGSLEARGDYESIDLVDRDLAGQSAESATFASCRIERCRMDGLDLRGSRIAESLLADNDATHVDVTDSVWRDTLVAGGRFGALTASGAAWTDVRLRGIKLDYLDLSGAKLSGVVFEACAIGELELAEADLRTVRFEASSVDVLDAASARFTDVDLSGAKLRTIGGIASLKGATISPEQLIDVAPLLARHLGIVVGGD
jgi:uncharacterized protein YjbI with pentapeptide repeats